MIDFKTVEGPNVDFSIPVGYTDIPGITITWAAQAGTLLVIASLTFRNLGLVDEKFNALSLLDGAPVPPPTGTPIHVHTLHYDNITFHRRAIIAAGNHTVKLQATALAIDEGLVMAHSALLTCIVFPPAMIA